MSANWNLLLVDDDPQIRDALQLAITGWGFNVSVAESGSDALQAMRQKSFAIVLADLQMPGMNGLTLLSRIRAKSLMTSVIMLTGHGTIEHAVKAMKLGASEFILKPVDLDHLRIILQKCMDNISERQSKRELRRINSKLIELNEMKEKFLSITSHELRTPLTVIRGYLEILKHQSGLDQESLDILDIIRRSTGQLDDTVNRIHALSICQAGKVPEAVQMSALSEIAEEVAEEMRVFSNNRNIDFQWEISCDPILPVRANILRTIFRELLQNAIKFTPDDGRVRLTVQENGERLEIEVIDSGIGIPYAKQEQIFASFYEVQDSANHHSSQDEFLGGGMGIGLSIVNDLVSNLGGKVKLQSHPGQGSQFVIELPLSEKEISSALA